MMTLQLQQLQCHSQPVLGAKVFAWLLVLQLQIYTFTALMSALCVVYSNHVFRQDT